MGHQRRIDEPGARHHVMNRGGARRDIFETEDDASMFKVCLADAVAATGVVVESYCLMGNHFHLGLFCPTAQLSRMMQHLTANYTRWFNVVHGIDGGLFKGRFRSVLVSDYAYLATFTRYIHRNPLDIGRDIRTYRHSSFQSYIGLRPPEPWLDPSFPRGLTGDSKSYERYVLQDLPSDKLLAASGATRTPCELQAALSTGGVPSVEAIIHEVRCAANGQWPQQTQSAITLLLAADLTGKSSTELSHQLGYATPASLRTALRRARFRLAAEPYLQDAKRQVVANLIGETVGV